MSLAERTTHGRAAMSGAAPRLVAFLTDLEGRPLPPGVVSWAVGDVQRDEIDQQEEVAEGRSSLLWPRSGHNQAPAQAIDVWPINENGDVEPNPNAPAYVLLEEVAADHGLETGRSWGDAGHVEVPGWRGLVAENGAAPAGPGLLLGILGLGALLLWGPRA